MSYFKEENFRGEKRLPSSFMAGFLEVSDRQIDSQESVTNNRFLGPQLDASHKISPLFRCVYKSNKKPSQNNCQSFCINRP